MNSRLPCFLLLISIVALPALSEMDSGIPQLFRGFQNPPREFSVRPFWFWNGKLDAKELDWQIRQMVEQGVYGAYAHNRTGLETPYLSDDYFAAVKAAFDSARSAGFLLGFVDDYEWPSGEARDVWASGLPSRVIAANPEFRMRSLQYIEKIAEGPASIEVETPVAIQFAVAARLAADDTIVPDSLSLIAEGGSGPRTTWQAPPGRWRLIAFYLQPSRGMDGGMVDLLNPEAIRKFLDLSYEQYYRRFKEHFGTTMDSSYADHEGDYGNRIAWTPGFFETFQKTKGYDLRKYLPLLMVDGGKLTPKIRCDYLDVISELYARSFFKQVSDWCTAHRIKTSGHVWEETLMMEAAYEGDLQRIMRAWLWPGVDSLWDRGRSPRDFKATASVAHFQGTRFTCENQGLQGADSFLDFQKMRLGTNMIATWGANLLIPHAFNYNRRRIEYPPDWFYHEPYWKYFRHYADYARRLCFMNAGGVHVADILVFQPTESAWAHSEPVFSNKFPYIPSKFNNPLDTINSYYTSIQNRLAQERWDFDIADSYFLRMGELKEQRLRIGNEAFRALVLPPLTTIRRETLRKIADFYDQGGIVIGMKMLPSSSMEEGRDDEVIAQTLRHIFGDSAPTKSASNSNARGGQSYFIIDNIEDIFPILARTLKQDVKVLTQDRIPLFYLHRSKDGVDFYWMVNDSENARDATVRFSVKGVPEKWDATDATRSPLYYFHPGEGTEVRLHFEPWEAFYVVFSPVKGKEQPIRIVDTNLIEYSIAPGMENRKRIRGLVDLTKDNSFSIRFGSGEESRQLAPDVSKTLKAIHFEGGWSFEPLLKQLTSPYAEVMQDSENKGESSGWHTLQFDSSNWPRTWLSRERLTVRDWWLIGPFPNDDHRGFNESYPPEKLIDLKASYAGLPGQSVTWQKWASDGYAIDFGKALGFVPGRNWVTCYAFTYIYSPLARRAQFRIAADNNAKLWVNGRNLFDWHIHPFYYEMREDFAYAREADLLAGWNEILVKVSKGTNAPSQYAFLLRITDAQGNNYDDLVVSPAKATPARQDGAADQKTVGRMWYRISAPPGAVAVRLPRFRGAARIFYNGETANADPAGLVRFSAPARGSNNVLVLQVSGDEVIADAPEFLLGRTLMEPGSWTDNGLPYYSGSAAYERDFDLRAEYVDKKLILDCGQVGVVAEAWVNGRPAGVRVWLPFKFDISKLVRPGKNHLKIIVTNTMENARAVENHAKKLSRIRLNGLLGPVQIIPYKEVELGLPPR